MRKRIKPPPQKTSLLYRQIWRIVDGAVVDAFQAHPEYISKGYKVKTVRESVVKRVTGALVGFAEESAKGRSGEKSAAERMV